MIEVSYEMGEYVAWAPDCLLMAFGETEAAARANLLDRAADSHDKLSDQLQRGRLSRHLAEIIPAIARLLAMEKA